MHSKAPPRCPSPALQLQQQQQQQRWQQHDGDVNGAHAQVSNAAGSVVSEEALVEVPEDTSEYDPAVY